MDGISFKEEASGTNAVALSMKLKKAVYTLPQHHYCTFLNNKYIYSRPLLINGTLLASIAILSQYKSINKELIAVYELLHHCIINDLTYDRESKKTLSPQCSGLNQKQREILLLFASGMTDKAVAIEKNVCMDTIKYHKKNIFKKLDATSTVQAVVQAIKQDLIKVDQIKF